MTEKQRRIEAVRRSIVDVELPLKRYFDVIADIQPSEVTRQNFAELQADAAILAEAIRREMQAMYDLLALFAQEMTPQELLLSLQQQVELERIRSERIKAKCIASTARWEARKAEQAQQAKASKRWKWFGM